MGKCVGCGKRARRGSLACQACVDRTAGVTRKKTILPQRGSFLNKLAWAIFWLGIPVLLFGLYIIYTNK